MCFKPDYTDVNDFSPDDDYEQELRAHDRHYRTLVRKNRQHPHPDDPDYQPFPEYSDYSDN